MRCPVCDSDNLDDSAECVSCGKAFPSRAEDGRAAAALEELEMTQVAPPEAPVRVEPLAGLEHTRLPADRAAQSQWTADRKSTRLNSSHLVISYAVFCLKKKKNRVEEKRE